MLACPVFTSRSGHRWARDRLANKDSEPAESHSWTLVQPFLLLGEGV